MITVLKTENNCNSGIISEENNITESQKEKLLDALRDMARAPSKEGYQKARVHL